MTKKKLAFPLPSESLFPPPPSFHIYEQYQPVPQAKNLGYIDCSFSHLYPYILYVTDFLSNICHFHPIPTISILPLLSKLNLAHVSLIATCLSTSSLKPVFYTADTVVFFKMYISQCFSNGGDFVPRANVWRHFWLSEVGECYWHLMGGNQGCSKHPRKYRTVPHHKELCDPKCQSCQGLRNPGLCRSSVVL